MKLTLLESENGKDRDLYLSDFSLIDKLLILLSHKRMKLHFNITKDKGAENDTN